MIKQSDNNENIINIPEEDMLISNKADFADNVEKVYNDEKGKMSYNDSSGYIIYSNNDKKDNYKTKNNHKKKRHKMKLWKKVLISVVSCILGLCIIVAGIFGFMYWYGKNQLLDKTGMKLTPPKNVDVIDNGNYIYYNGHTYRYKDSMTSILFMGVDKEDEFGLESDVVGTGGQADALYLITIDTDTGVTTTFQISRNTMIDINIKDSEGNFIRTENSQICLSYAYGDGKETSAENCITSVRRLFYGLPVAQSYVAFDIAGISAINDAVGGVTVTSPVDYGDKYIEGETYELHGDEAESFVRSRDISKVSSNTNRMARQKAYINAFVDKAASMTKEKITTPITLYNQADPYMVTDISASKVSYLAVDLLNKGVTNTEIQRVPGKDKMGKEYAEYYVNNDKFFKMIVDNFYVQVD